MGAVTRSNILKNAGVKHGFSTRTSEGEAGSLNVKSESGMPGESQTAARNRSKILSQAGLDPDKEVFLRRLAHGNTVFQAHRRDSGHEIDNYDCIVTDDPIVVSLSVADCVPILLYAPDKNAVAAVHAGWRSTQAGAVHEAIKELERLYGADPIQLIAVLGPSICGDCYEIGEEVGDLFDADHQKTKSGRTTLDLRAANRRQLKLAGVAKIDDLDVCTYENNDRYFSARAEGQTGRFLAFIAPKHK